MRSGYSAGGKSACRVTSGGGEVLPRAQFVRPPMAALRGGLGDWRMVVDAPGAGYWGEV